MSGVVLRCPNCGTTRATSGECEACHEAQTRYYCTNHTPGRWLDAATCSQCGAAFGVAARAPAPAPTPRSGPAVAPASSRRPPASPAPAAPRRPPLSPGPPPESGRPDDFSDRPYRAGGGVDPTPADPEADRRPRWQELLLAAARAAAARRDAARGIEPAPSRRGRGGCLFRFIMIAVIGLFALIAAPSLFGAFLLRLLGGY